MQPTPGSRLALSRMCLFLFANCFSSLFSLPLSLSLSFFLFSQRQHIPIPNWTRAGERSNRRTAAATTTTWHWTVGRKRMRWHHPLPPRKRMRPRKRRTYGECSRSPRTIPKTGNQKNGVPKNLKQLKPKKGFSKYRSRCRPKITRDKGPL